MVPFVWSSLLPCVALRDIDPAHTPLAYAGGTFQVWVGAGLVHVLPHFSDRLAVVAGPSRSGVYRFAPPPAARRSLVPQPVPK